MGTMIAKWSALAMMTALFSCFGCSGESPRTEGVGVGGHEQVSATSSQPMKASSAEPMKAHPADSSVHPAGPEGPRKLGVEECVEIALRNNHQRPASRYAVEAAEAQHRQALSSFWPQLSLNVLFMRLDQDPLFVFPSSTMGIPAMSIPVPAQSVTIPANSFGPGFPPVAVPLSTPAQTFTVPAQTFTVPEQRITLMDRDTAIGSLDMMFPLYTGGKRTAIVNQAKYGVEVAKEEVRRTDLQVIYDVKRMYYGAVLARSLHQLGIEALDRMTATLTLTESLYQKGSGKVKKTDYLRNKIMVEGVRATVSQLAANEQLAKSALVNSMGLDWQTTIELSDAGLPFLPHEADLSQLVAEARLSNPDCSKIAWGIKALEAKEDEAMSGYLPKVALMASVKNIDNSYEYGVVTAQNRGSWSIGIGVEVPIFTGWRTTNEVREAKARLSQIKEQQILLREGIALEVKAVVLQMSSAQDQAKAMEASKQAAEENRDLCTRAYQDELVETNEVIQAQLLESIMKAMHYKALYEHAESRVHLDFVVGNEVHTLLGLK
jgi:outer membrane protein TolC